MSPPFRTDGMGVILFLHPAFSRSCILSAHFLLFQRATLFPVFVVYVIVLRRGIHDAPRTARKGCSFFMKLSARNQLKGTVTEINEGAVNAIVKIDIGGGNVISATISMASVKELGQYRTNELVRRRMNFSSDAMADFEGLLEVNRKICKQQMAEKASPTLPTNCAVLP